MSLRKTTDRLCIITRKADGARFKIYYDPDLNDADDVSAGIKGDCEVFDVGPQTARLVEKLDQQNWSDPALYFMAKVNALKGELEGYAEDLKDLRVCAAEIPDLMEKTDRTIATLEAMAVWLEATYNAGRTIYNEHKPD